MGGGGGLLGGVGSFLFGDGGSSAQADAARAGAQASQEATDRSLALQKYMYDNNLALAKPTYDLSQSAMQQAFASKDANGNVTFDPNKLNQYTVNSPFQYQDFNGNQNITSDPSYQFRLQQGVNALNNSGAARGMTLSGAQQKALTDYGQNAASQEYQNAYNRNLGTYQQNQGNALTSYNSNVNLGTQRYNQLASVLGLGQTAGSQLNQNNTNMAQMGTNTNMTNANNLASAYAYGGNAIANGQQYATNSLLKLGQMGAGIAMSDIRLKRNIKKIGELSNGLNVYEFDYIWGEHSVGVMAQEALKVIPEAVHNIDGYLAVDYSMIGA